ncbi:MAG TPA: deoxyguanosinetriphosphate triphosphohydrolase [Terriglobales bacterium]|nr:deoxyguanosinetriphosphate triphosphohydrolase [Terriglobales bacterium]
MARTQPAFVHSLAALAVPANSLRGRRHHEAPHPYRNDFQRDRDRVVHSRAFRRLENKTQVFTRRFSDHFRNRLTHTIEVAQISRTIAGALRLNVDLAEALALVHDVGHPPFGHAGEKALDAAMRAHGFAFDHNLHALRIVEDFESRYAGFRGLNLTFEVREGIVKHSRDYPARAHPDLVEYRLDERPPLEAQLIDLTDEIAYASADLDDGYEARILALNDVRGHVVLFERAYSEAHHRFPKASEKLLFNEALRRMLDSLVTGLIRNTAANVAEAGVDSLEQVRAHPQRLVGFDAAMEAERRQAKDFLYERLYYSRELQPEKELAERIVTELFEHWIAHPEALPESYHAKLKREPLPRIICDYIAGMTDNYILEQHEKMLG